MHYMPDTEEEDSAAETFWPEGYKQVIRTDVRQAIGSQLNGKKRFRRVYREGYSEKYSSYEQFLDRIADMVAIGAENGADDTFDDIVDALLAEEALPEERKYTRYFWPEIFPPKVKEKFRRIIVDEYSEDNVYDFAYKVGYRNDFSSFDEYINKVAKIVTTGSMNGANDMLEGIYRSFTHLSPLTPARRHSRRLKNW
jgi:hypothetical protein